MIKKLILALFLGAAAFEPIVAQTSWAARNSTRSQNRTVTYFSSESTAIARTTGRTFYGKDGSKFIIKSDGAYIGEERVSEPAKLSNFSKTVALFTAKDLKSGQVLDITYNAERGVITYGSKTFYKDKQ